MTRTCPCCGSCELEPGAIQSTGRLTFRPDNAKFFSLKTADVPVKANICTECGHIMLIGNVQKANELVTGRAEAN
jgi:hypothetical protein